MQLPEIIEVRGVRVLTTKQLSEMYETKGDTIKMNFSRNRERYIEGKHYLAFTGDELKAFKNEVTKCYLVGNRTSHLYLWTEKGALLHAKSLNTDKAWEVYDYLVDFYFRVKEEKKPTVSSTTPVPTTPCKLPEKKNGREMVDIPENVNIQEKLNTVRDYITALQVALIEYNKYQSEGSYKHRNLAVSNLAVELMSKALDLVETKPNIVTKTGY